MLNCFGYLFAVLLQVTTLLALAVYTGADNTYVVLAPKTIRPGLAINIQYNTRKADSYDAVLTELLQDNAVKSSNRRTFIGGQYLFIVLRHQSFQCINFSIMKEACLPLTNYCIIQNIHHGWRYLLVMSPSI